MRYWPAALKEADYYTILGQMQGLLEAWTGRDDFQMREINQVWPHLRLHQQLRLTELLHRLAPEFIEQTITWEIEEAEANNVQFGEKFVGMNNWGWFLYCLLILIPGKSPLQALLRQFPGVDGP